MKGNRGEEEGGKAGKGREGQERKCRIKCGENINIVWTDSHYKRPILKIERQWQ